MHYTNTDLALDRLIIVAPSRTHPVFQALDLVTDLDNLTNMLTIRIARDAYFDGLFVGKSRVSCYLVLPIQGGNKGIVLRYATLRSDILFDIIFLHISIIIPIYRSQALTHRIHNTSTDVQNMVVRSVLSRIYSDAADSLV